MRPVLAALSLLLISPLCAAELQIVRVWPSYRATDSFVHVSDYFTGKEATRGEILLRSQSDVRAGYYFLTRIKNPGPAVPDAHIEINVILPDSPLPRTYKFTSTVQSGSHVLQLGLTGKDWPGPAVQPVAWQLRVLSSAGVELAKEQSFVWALPEKKKPS